MKRQQAEKGTCNQTGHECDGSGRNRHKGCASSCVQHDSCRGQDCDRACSVNVEELLEKINRAVLTDSGHNK